MGDTQEHERRKDGDTLEEKSKDPMNTEDGDKQFVRDCQNTADALPGE